MPVHAHDGAEGLEPEGMGQTAQELVAAIVMDDRLGDHGAEARHALRQPGRHLAVVKRQIGAARASCHANSSRTKCEPPPSTTSRSFTTIRPFASLGWTKGGRLAHQAAAPPLRSRNP